MVEVEVPQIAPFVEGAFEGRVWVPIDRFSFSNAAVIAATMQDAGMAKLLGEQTADLPTTYGAVESFSLPHSGASIVYPKAYMVRPSGSEAVQGVAPDIELAPRPVGEGAYALLDSAVATVLAAR